jgi:predicted TIM-barrel fold metal-dependent hydrolase
MDKADIEKSVVCCIATKPEQFEPILRWCTAIRSDRLIPLPSVHPADPACLDGIRRIRAEGFQGIKLHPFYQDFFADDDRMFQFYEEVVHQGLLLVMHTGYDIAFPRIRRADPPKLLGIAETFPDLKLVTTPGRGSNGMRCAVTCSAGKSTWKCRSPWRSSAPSGRVR